MTNYKRIYRIYRSVFLFIYKTEPVIKRIIGKAFLLRPDEQSITTLQTPLLTEVVIPGMHFDRLS